MTGETTMTEAQASTATVKSIVNPKYRDKYKKPEAKDWLSKLLDAEATKTREVKKTVVNPENPDEKITTTEQRADGIDVDKLFQIAKNNGINTANLQGHEADHGFAGRARMTIANGMRRVIKERHGCFNLGRTFLTAPPEMLNKLQADAEPTHNQDGTKIAKAKPEVAQAAEQPAADAPAADKPKRGKKAGTEEA
jgi:hypothetical protein